MPNISRQSKKQGLFDLTVCILSLERHESLRRQIKYYSKAKVNVVILDASKNHALLDNAPNIEYHHIPNSTFHFRLNYISKVVKTDYIVLQADDDFHGIEGLNSCLAFLKENKEFTCAQGRFLRFYSSEVGRWGTDYDFQNSLSIQSNNAELRVNQFFNSGMHFIYSVMPTQVFIQVVQILKNIEIGNMMMNELIFNFSLGCFGKYKTIPIFYSARGMDLRPNGLNSSSFMSWKLSENGKDFEIFQSAISELFKQKLNHDRDCGEMIAKQLISRYDLRLSQEKTVNESLILPRRTKSVLLINRGNKLLKKSSWLRSLSKYRRRSLWCFFWDVTSNFNLLKFIKDFSRIKNAIQENL